MLSIYLISFLNRLTILSSKLKIYKASKILLNLQKRIIFSKLFDLHNSHENTLTQYSDDVFKGDVIWICWFQGLNTAPTIVKKCINNLIKFNKDKKIIIITSNNFKDYVDIPEYILEKVNNGSITLTHFSDILRFALLSKYGGVWIDATYLTLNSLPNDVFDNDFFTLKSNREEFLCWLPQGRWSGNFIKFRCGDVNALYIYNMFLLYWSKNNKLIHYFLIDYIICFTYENKKDFQYMVDNCAIYGDNVLNLMKILFNKININDDNLILNDNVKIYKMTYKISKSHKFKSNTYYFRYFS